MRLYVCLLALVLATAVQAQDVAESFVKFSGLSASATQPVTVAAAIVYSDAMRFTGGSAHSIAMTIDTTETVAVTIEVQLASTTASGTTTYQSGDTAITKSITGDYDKRWAIDLPVSATGRLKFGVSTAGGGGGSGPSAYEIKNLKLFKD